jgi:hypothetical protein
MPSLLRMGIAGKDFPQMGGMNGSEWLEGMNGPTGTTPV